MTLGRSLFHDALFEALTIGDTRFELEKKLVACLATGGTNGNPVLPHRIKNRHFRSLTLRGMKPSWSIKNLLEINDECQPAAEMALVATLEKPVWGHHDVRLLECVECYENLRGLAIRGGRTL
jgi:hypothetical protein